MNNQLAMCKAHTRELDNENSFKNADYQVHSENILTKFHELRNVALGKSGRQLLCIAAPARIAPLS